MNNEYEAGLFSQGEDEYLEGVVEQDSTYDIYFSTTGSDPIYTYFNLYNFTDDLDLALYQYSEKLNEYTSKFFKGFNGVFSNITIIFI